MAPQPPTDKTLKSAGVMGVATFMSRILGLVREQVFAIFFGASHANDAFQIAFRIPNLLRDLFAEGAMSAALVPTFVAEKKQRGLDSAWRLARAVFRTFFVVGLGIAVIGMIFAPELVTLYASSYKEVPGKFELTVWLTRWMVFFFPWVVLAAACMAVLNAMGKFFMPAFASAVFNIVSIIVGIVCVWLAPELSWEPITGMAVGVVVGGIAQALCQWPVLWKVGYQPGRPSSVLSGFSHPGLKKMAWLMVPGTVGLAATQINILVNSILATGEGAGAVSWLNYAFRLMQFPIGVFGVSLAQATLPAVSALWVEKNYGGVAHRLHQSMLQVFAINVPAAFGLVAVGPLLISVLFEHGAFTAQDTRATAMALSAYAVGLAFYSGVKVLVPVFYAFGDTKVPLITSLLSVVINLGLNLWLIGPFGFWGLALGTSITACVNWILLMVFAQRILAREGVGFPWISFATSVTKQVVAGGSMALGCMWLIEALQTLDLPNLGVLLCAVGLGVILTVLFSLGLGMHETTHVLRALKRRVWK